MFIEPSLAPCGITSTLGLRGRAAHRTAAVTGPGPGLRFVAALLTHGQPTPGRDSDRPATSLRYQREGSRPSRCATAAASTRPLTPSLARMLDTCTLAVLVLINKARPISGLDRPAASRAS